jgi:hypothetical protein
MAFTQFINGSLPLTGAAALWSVIQMWIAAGATKLADSDGTTYSSSGAQVTGGGSGTNGLGNTSAWVRIRFPDNREVTIQRGSSNTQWRVKYSKAAFFTGGSPGAARTPSATDEALRFGGGTDASPTYSTLFTTDNTYKLYGGCDPVAGWWFATIVIIGGAVSAGAWMDVLGTPSASDADPSVIHVATTTNPFVVASISDNAAIITNSGVFSWLNFGGGSASYVATPALTVNDSGGAVWPLNAGVNPNTGKDQLRLIEYARKTGAGTTGGKGVSSFVAWLSAARSAGETFTVSTTRDRISFGVVSFPWNGAVVL